MFWTCSQYSDYHWNYCYPLLPKSLYFELKILVLCNIFYLPLLDFTVFWYGYINELYLCLFNHCDIWYIVCQMFVSLDFWNSTGFWRHLTVKPFHLCVPPFLTLCFSITASVYSRHWLPFTVLSTLAAIAFVRRELGFKLTRKLLAGILRSLFPRYHL